MTTFMYPIFGTAEDLVVGILKPLESQITGLKVRSYLEGEATFDVPYIFVRKEAGAWSSTAFTGEYRFIRRALVSIDCFTSDGVDGNGDLRGAMLQEIILHQLMAAHRNQTVIPQQGSVSRMVCTSPAHRSNDWATGTQVVQYASLPKGWYRYESSFGLLIRPDRTNQPDPTALF